MTYADGTTLNTATGFTESGLVSGDAITSVSLTTDATTSHSGNWNAGAWSITPSGASGSGLSNYAITYDNATTGLTVAAKPLSIAGLSGTNKVYDATTNDPITGNGTLSGVVSGLNNTGGTSDVVNLTNGSAAFGDANVGTGKTVTFTSYSISGLDAGNYSLLQPVASTASITAAVSTTPVLPPGIINPPAPPSNGNSPGNNDPTNGSTNEPPVLTYPPAPPSNTNNPSANDPTNDPTNNPSPPSSSPVNQGGGNSNSGTNSNSTPPAGKTSASSPNARTTTDVHTDSRNFGSNRTYGAYGQPANPRSDDSRQPQAVVYDDRNFNVLNQQLDALEEPVSEQSQRIKRVVVPGVVALSMMSLGYMLLFSRALYVTLATAGMTTLRQKLDPASLLEYWERESKERVVMDQEDKNMEGMFE